MAVEELSLAGLSLAEPPATEPPVTTVETTVTLKATEDGTLDDAAAVAALAEELGVDAERITLVPSFDGTLEEGATMAVKVVVEVAPEDATNQGARVSLVFKNALLLPSGKKGHGLPGSGTRSDRKKAKIRVAGDERPKPGRRRRRRATASR